MERQRIPLDPVLKRMFDDPEMVISVLKDLVKAGFIRYLDYKSIKAYPNDFINSALRERILDKVWKINWKNNRFVYALVMVEFQSYTDHYMPLRIAEYSLLLWKHLVESKQIKKDEKFPVLLPIVFYLGKDKWNVPDDLAELQEKLPEELSVLQPRQKYILIDVNELSDEIISNGEGIATDFVHLQRVKNTDELTDLVKSILEKRKSEKFENIKKIFAEYINIFLYNKGRIHKLPDNIHDLKEVNTMLLMEANWDKNDEALVARGYEKGEVIGLERGKVMGLEQGKVIGLEQGKVIGREEANDEAIRELIYKSHNLELSHAQVLSLLTDIYKLSAEEAEARITKYRQ